MAGPKRRDALLSSARAKIDVLEKERDDLRKRVAGYCDQFDTMAADTADEETRQWLEDRRDTYQHVLSMIGGE